MKAATTSLFKTCRVVWNAPLWPLHLFLLAVLSSGFEATSLNNQSNTIPFTLCVHMSINVESQGRCTCVPPYFLRHCLWSSNTLTWLDWLPGSPSDRFIGACCCTHFFTLVLGIGKMLRRRALNTKLETREPNVPRWLLTSAQTPPIQNS